MLDHDGGGVGSRHRAVCRVPEGWQGGDQAIRHECKGWAGKYSKVQVYRKWREGPVSWATSVEGVVPTD